MKRIICCALIALGFGACSARRVAAVDPLPTIPVSYEVNLETMRACEFRGIVVGDGEARALDANLVVGFKYSRQESVSNGVRSVGYGAVHGKAVRCPVEVVQRLLQKEHP